MVEKVNGQLKAQIYAACGSATSEWDLFVDQALFNLRVRIHQTTGFSPFRLMYGVEPKLPGDMTPPYVFDSPSQALQQEQKRRIWTDLNAYREAAARNSESAHRRASHQHNSRIVLAPLIIGEWVLLKRPKRNKMMPGWVGPFEVVRKTDVGTYLIADPHGTILPTHVHRDLLKRVHLKPDEKPTRLWGQLDGTLDLRELPGIFDLKGGGVMRSPTSIT